MGLPKPRGSLCLERVSGVPRLPQLAFPSGLSHFHVFDSPLLQFQLLFLAMLIKDASRPSRASRPEALTSHLIRIHHQHFDSYFINCTNFLHWPSSCHQVISKLLAELDSHLTGWSGTAFFFFSPWIVGDLDQNAGYQAGGWQAPVTRPGTVLDI